MAGAVRVKTTQALLLYMHSTLSSSETLRHPIALLLSPFVRTATKPVLFTLLTSTTLPQ